MDNLPDSVKEQFYITNYYIELELTEEKCQKLLEDIEKRCDELMELESLSEEDQDSFAEVNHRYNPDDYYETHLCSYHTSELFKKKESLLKNVLKPEFSVEENNQDNEMHSLFNDDKEDTTLEELFS